MKLNKTIIIPLLILLFAAFGFEQLVLPYVSFGSGRWSDSIGTNVSNRKARINGDLNVTGNYYKNGILFSGGSGTPIVVSNEGTEVESEMSSINFVGNIFTAASSSGDVTLTSNVDTNNYFSRYRLDTSNLAMLNEAASFAGDISGANISTTGTLSAADINISNVADVWTLSVGSTATFIAGGITLADATKVIINSGNDILYKVSTGGAHKFQTAGGTILAKVDSSRGLAQRIEGINSFWGGATMIYEKLVALKVGNSNSTTTAAHGLNHNNILGWKCEIRDDTTNTHVSPGTWFSPWVFYAKIDSLTVTVTVPASPSGTSVANDSAFFLIRYFQ